MTDRGKELAVRVKPVDRRQMVLHPVDVDKLVPEDHEARAIWEFVSRVDIRAFYEDIQAVEGSAGASAWDPLVLICLWIYAYSRGIGSAREIARRCEYDPGFQWLTGMQEINYHTLADFRVEHKQRLDELFTEILGVLAAEGMISMKRVMHDGCKVKANAGSDTFRREGRLEYHLERARQQVEELSREECAERFEARKAKARQRAARERQERLEKALKELEKVRKTKKTREEKKEARVSTTDPEARIMKQSDGGFAPSYNVQLSTDASHTVIVAAGVSQAGSDYEELMPAVERMEENLQQKPQQMVVDGGFTSRSNIIGMSELGIDLIGSLGNGKAQSAGQMDRRGVDPAFRPEAFIYDEHNDCYRCPAGKLLSYNNKEKRVGRTNHKYQAKPGECQHCQFKDRCCPQNASKGRSIVRGVDDPAVVEFTKKMQTEEAKQIYKTRGQVVEFTNAWLKDKIGIKQFRLRGLLKVTMEVLWAAITHNIKQWIRVRWRPRWVEAHA